MYDVFIAHTTIEPKLSISLIKMPFSILQVNFHTNRSRSLQALPVSETKTFEGLLPYMGMVAILVM